MFKVCGYSCRSTLEYKIKVHCLVILPASQPPYIHNQGQFQLLSNRSKLCNASVDSKGMLKQTSRLAFKQQILRSGEKTIKQTFLQAEDE